MLSEVQLRDVSFGGVCAAFWMGAVCGFGPGVAAAQAGAFSLDEGGGSERPCHVSFEGGRPHLAVSLEQVRGDWRMTFWVSSAPAAMIGFFGANGLRDDEAVRAATKELLIGANAVETTDAYFWEVQRSDLSDRSTVSVTLEPLRKVADALRDFPEDQIRIGAVTSVSGLSDGLTAFKACALAAIDVPEAEALAFDARAESRIAFEAAFPEWVKWRARLASCRLSADDDAELAEMVDLGADAFYPGLLSYYLRSDWSKHMNGQISMAKLDGATEALTDGCFVGLDVLESGWRNVLDESLERAGN